MKTITNTSSLILTGMVTTLGLVLIGSILTSMIIQFTKVSELNLPLFTYCINGLSIFVGGYISGRRGRQKGWYFGGLTGVVYFILMLLIGFFAFDLIIQLSTFTSIIIAFAVGALGGIFGVNSITNKQ